MALVLSAAVAVLLSSMTDELAKAFLDLTGKDITLTGRTDLWAVAFQEIAERPVLGTGFQAFWVQGNPLAEQLWAMFGIGSRAGFHFHNTLISNTVEIGLVGATLQAADGQPVAPATPLQALRHGALFFAGGAAALPLLLPPESSESDEHALPISAITTANDTRKPPRISLSISRRSRFVGRPAPRSRRG